MLRSILPAPVLRRCSARSQSSNTMNILSITLMHPHYASTFSTRGMIAHSASSSCPLHSSSSSSSCCRPFSTFSPSARHSRPLRTSRRRSSSSFVSPEQEAYDTVMLAARRIAPQLQALQEKSERPVYRGMFRYAYGLPDHSFYTHLATHRVAFDVNAAKQTIARIQAIVNTEAHALDLDASLRGKCAHDPNSRVNRAYKQLAKRTQIVQAEVISLNDTLMMEQFRKEFILYTPTTSDTATRKNGKKKATKSLTTEGSTNATSEASESAVVTSSEAITSSPSSDSTSPLSHASALRIIMTWSQHRHAVRAELAPHEFHAKIELTPLRQYVKKEGSETSMEHGMEEMEKIVLMDVTADQTNVDAEILRDMRTLYAGNDSFSSSSSPTSPTSTSPPPSSSSSSSTSAVTTLSSEPLLSHRDWCWYLSFLASHPSDHAFDVVSKVLLDAEC